MFFNAYFLAYLVSPRMCHAAVGYLEEEAVKTYTHALQVSLGVAWSVVMGVTQLHTCVGLPGGGGRQDAHTR